MKLGEMCLRFLWVRRCAAAFCTNFSQAITEALTSTGKEVQWYSLMVPKAWMKIQIRVNGPHFGRLPSMKKGSPLSVILEKVWFSYDLKSSRGFWRVSTNAFWGEKTKHLVPNPEIKDLVAGGRFPSLWCQSLYSNQLPSGRLKCNSELCQIGGERFILTTNQFISQFVVTGPIRSWYLNHWPKTGWGHL